MDGPSVGVGRYRQLRNLTWNRRNHDRIPECDALALYERNWRYLDADLMDLEERKFLRYLIETYGNGILHI